MVEHKGLYIIVVRRMGKRADPLEEAVISGMKFRRDEAKTISLDYAFEVIRHITIVIYLNTKIYFAHHYTIQERDINESKTGLIR